MIIILNKLLNFKQVHKENQLKEDLTIEKITTFFTKNHTNEKYWDRKTPKPELLKEWRKHIHAAELLKDTFKEFAGTLLPYRKTKHSVELTEWLIQNKPDELEELKELLKKFYD